MDRTNFLMEIEYLGVVRWGCGCSSGEWSRQPDTVDCRHKWLARLESEFNSTAGNRRDARQISQKLSEALRIALRDGEFSGGDIIGCIWLSREVLALATEQVRRMADFEEKRTFALNFAQVSIGVAILLSICRFRTLEMRATSFLVTLLCRRGEACRRRTAYSRQLP